jgi:hypothetical protein
MQWFVEVVADSGLLTAGMSGKAQNCNWHVLRHDFGKACAERVPFNT